MTASPTDGRPADARFSRWQAESGQTMVEYGFVLIAIAVAALTAFQVFGGRVSDLVNTVNIA
jgi:Flp pilus assembly pilin Flp